MSLSAWLRPAVPLEEQHAAAARQIEQRLAEQGTSAAPARGTVGRPRGLNRDTVTSALAGQKHGRDASLEADAEEGKQKRIYKQWLSSDLFPHIVDAYNSNRHSARAAVKYLQGHRALNANGVFDSLNPGTVHRWFDASTHTLTPRTLQLRSNAERYSRVGIAGRPRILDEFPSVEAEMKQQLLALRAGGVSMHLSIVKCIVTSILAPHQAGERLKLSRTWLQRWISDVMDWSWRSSTSSAGKLPSGWQESATVLGKRVAVDMHEYSIHESLVINADQTGLQLCPGAAHTYEQRGAKRVAVAGHEDKRQITCVVASALSGELLPLQLVFTVKTDACHPPATADHPAVQQGMHLTHSPNHWSNLGTTQDWIRRIAEPWRLRKIAEHNLKPDAHVLLILDVWRTHISPEFRGWLEQEFPHYHLRFVPPNCTSELQVADVALNYPLKHCVKKKFNDYVAQSVTAAMEAAEGKRATALHKMLLMSELKPRLLLWLAQAWTLLAQEKLLIYKGWKRCLLRFYDVMDAAKREAAVKEAKEMEVDTDVGVPAGAAAAVEASDPATADVDSEEHDSDEDEKPTRQVMRERVYGERRSSRSRKEPERLGTMLRTDQMQILPGRDEDL